jgi:putative oxidoreductase
MERTTIYGALVLRLALGTMFIAHAGLKYFVFTLPGTAQFSNRWDCRRGSAT